MQIDWSARIRGYRQRSGMTQDALAAMFMVDVRTLRRWEKGEVQPPLDIRDRLLRTNVPLIKRPEIIALRQIIEQSAAGTMLMDHELNIICMSPSEREFWRRQYGVDLVGQNWEPFIPPHFRQLFDAHGGWRNAIKAGASSLTADFRIPMPGTGQGTYTGRVQYTILRMSDGALVHNYLGTTLPDDVDLQPPRLTFLDEIEQTE